MKHVILTILIALFSNGLLAQASLFKEGQVIKGFGKYAVVNNVGVDDATVLKVAFDVSQAAKPGEVNPDFDSLARFLNMHVAAGVKQENIHLALVVHGRAGLDLLNNQSYKKAQDADNFNKALVEALLANNVRVLLCGQSAAGYEISQEQLIKGSKVELSAMTAHALLQQEGYTLNPF